MGGILGPSIFNGNNRNIQCNARNIHSASFLATALINKPFLLKIKTLSKMKLSTKKSPINVLIAFLIFVSALLFSNANYVYSQCCSLPINGSVQGSVYTCSFDDNTFFYIRTA